MGVVYINFHDYPNLVVANYGTGSFGAAINTTVPNGPASKALADFNGDGKLDLAFTNGYNSNLSVLLGNGNGGFGSPTNFIVGGPGPVVVGDFNGDGKPDLVATQPFDNNTIDLLLNCTSSINTAPTVANAIPTLSGTVGQAVSYLIPAHIFTDAEPPNSLTLTAINLPSRLSLVGSTITGILSASGVFAVSIRATDPGGLTAVASFSVTVSTPAMVSTDPATLTITSFSCNIGSDGGGSVNLVVGYSDGSVSPTLPALFINGVTASGALGQLYTLSFDGNQSRVAIQDQASRSTYFVWDYRAACERRSSRLGVETRQPWQVMLLGNPSVSEYAEIELQQALGQNLQLSVSDLAGHGVSVQLVPVSTSVQRVRVQLGQSRGLYLVQVSDGTRQQTLRVLRP